MKTYYQDNLLTIESKLDMLGDIKVLAAALNQVNIMVAAAFCRKPKAITIEFCQCIVAKNQKRLSQCVGTCDLYSNHIQLVWRNGWQNTCLHELAHLYKPTATESQIYIVANDLVKFLKFCNQSIS